MKHLLFILALVVVTSTSSATNYYVSAAGNDANNGTSPATPWRTLTKVNAFTYAANDSVLLRRGDVFYGAIVVNRNNMNFAAYGNGERPLITGLVSVSGWTNLGNGVYQSAAVNAKSWLNMVTMNGIPQQIGRFPNADAANGGYLTYEGATSLSITDNELNNNIDWTGAEVAIRKNGWIIDRVIITSHTGSTVNYKMGRNINSGSVPLLSNAKLNHGYFFMDDPRTLDQLGEWYFDSSAKKLSMYFGSNAPAGYQIKVSGLDTLMNMNTRTNVSVNNINFEGANMSAVFSMNAAFIKVQNCDIVNSGGKAIHIFNSSDALVENLNINYSLSNAIQILNRTKTNATVRNCVVKNTGTYAGMGSFYDDSDHKGIAVFATSNVLIEGNSVDSTALSSIQFGGNNVLVQKNVINHYCLKVHDNGGIYTYIGGNDANPAGYFTNRVVRNNIIMNGAGAVLGTNSNVPALAGIYLDGRTMNVEVIDNSIFNNTKHGIHCNNPSGITIRGNTFFNNLNDISFMRWAGSSISNLNIKKNISFPFSDQQRNIYYTNATLNNVTPTALADNIKTLGSIDSNYYHTFTDAGFMFEMYDSLTGTPVPTSPHSLDAWKLLSSYDGKAKRPAQKIEPYTIINNVTGNAFSNGQFTSNITGMTVFGASVTATWDNTSKLTGVGSLRMNFLAPIANRYGMLHSPVGAINNAKKYIIRFNIKGGSPNGIVRAYIRKTSSPFNNLVPTQTKAFGMNTSTQEFLFTSPITETAGSLVIEVEQFSGTTYIDNVEFIEVNATVNTVQSQVRFEYNPTSVNRTIALDAKYIGVDSTVYNGTITIAPYSSKILIKGGTIDTVPVVNAGADRAVVLPLDSTVVGGIATGGTIVSYRWTKISGPVQYSIVSPNNNATKIANLVAGIYRFELRATTNKGMIGFDTLSIVVTPGILPVELREFKATKGNGNVQTQWITSSEVNTSHYMVQRSTEGRVFNNVGRVAANNTLTGENQYRFLDATPVPGNNYYRLAMVDHDGTTTYSRTVLVQFGTLQPLAIAQTKLQGSVLNFSLASTQQQPTNLLVLDASGRTMVSRSLQVQNGLNQYSVNLPSVSKGIYYMKLITADESLVKPIMSE